MKTHKLKTYLKKGLLWSLVFTLLLSSSAMAAITSELFQGEIPIEDTETLLKQAAEIQSITHVFKKCIGSIPGHHEDHNTSITTTHGTYNLYSGSVFDESDVSVGARLHKYYTGTTSYSSINGLIECNDAKFDDMDGYSQNRILVNFAKKIGKTTKEVLCNGDRPGLIGGVNNDKELDSSTPCWAYYVAGRSWTGQEGTNGEWGGIVHSYTYNDSYGDYTADGDHYTNGQGYVKALYNRFVENSGNPYLSKWDDLNDFSGGKGYFQTYGDFEVGCNAREYNDCFNGGDNACERIRIVDEYGGIKKKMYEYKTDGKEQASITNVRRSCSELADAVNDYAKQYAKDVREKRKIACNTATKDYWIALRKQSEVAIKTTPAETGDITLKDKDGNEITFNFKNYTIDNDGNQVVLKFSDEDLNEARENIAEINEMEANNKFWAEKDDGGIECRIPKNFQLSIIPVTPLPGIETPEEELEKTCSNQGGARGLGWIVCTVMNWMGSAAEGVYNDFLKPQLEVSPQLFARPGNNVNNAPAPTEQAWKIFQGMANILFSIVLLVIIFSQLTGIGIDNYGIKKILPKLVLTAVLANLSYVICQAAVDVSNIVGNGTQNLLNNMIGEVKITIPDSGIDGTAGNGSIPITVISGVIIAGLLVGMIGAIWQNPAIILSLLVSLLGVLIAILFIFILLAARQAAIVILIVISPLALVCYALPNTKKLFDKWLKIMQGLLLVYPICGILIGGGNFASRILLAAGMDESFAGALTAMLVSIVPLFFIPTVLKNSLNAMGSLGNKISGFGKNRSSGVQRRIRGTERYKDAQKMGLQRRTRIRAGLDKNGQLTARGRRRSTRASQTTGVRGFFNRMTGAQQRNANYIQAAKKNQATDEEANATLNNALSVSGIAAMQNAINQGGPNAPTDGAGNAMHDAKLAYYEAQFQQAARQGNISQMNAIIEAAEKSGFVKAKDIAAMLRRNYGNIRGVNDVARAAWMRDLATKHGDSFLATDLEQREWLKRGGEGNLGNYGEYAMGGGANGTRGINLDDIKPEDILKLSGDSLAGLARAGAIDQGMAQRIMAMNPNMSADKRVMLGAIANGNATGATYDANGRFTGSGTIRDAATFKRESQALMNAVSNASTRANIPNMQLTSMSNVSAESVQAWTTATPQQVNIVQNFNTTGDVGQREAVWTDTNALNIPHSAPSIQQRQQQQQQRQQQQQHPPVNNPQGGQQGNP